MHTYIIVQSTTIGILNINAQQVIQMHTYQTVQVHIKFNLITFNINLNCLICMHLELLAGH